MIWSARMRTKLQRIHVSSRKTNSALSRNHTGPSHAGPGPLQHAHRALDIQRIAIAGVGIDNEISAFDAIVNQRHGIAREYARADAPGGLDAAGDVVGRFLRAQGPKLASQGDALLQLPQRHIVQPPGQLGLPGNDHGNQLGLTGLDVRQQPDFLQQVERQALRLVDDEHRRLAPFVALAQQ